ncbi:response regulator [Pseudidiomarina mangrovi]|uniref:response regulator n=1 Tax=Pseudidiomarina mangrovi TaxID=2487133 RepID=UPI000FCA4EED|nr:response regulator [Pseudidiomarina mangrovi]
MALQLLLVEDKPATRAALLTVLQQSEFRVTCANDGLDGLNHAKQITFDVIIVDHKMPLMDGVTLCRNLRDLSAYKQTPIVLLTTQEISQVEPLARKAGADLCLSKPVDGERLLRLLSDLSATQTLYPVSDLR